MQKFVHAGVDITLLENGTFSAIVAGNRVSKPSLDAMKKFIDKQAKAAFTAAFTECRVIVRTHRYIEAKDQVGGVDGYKRVTMVAPPRLMRRKYGRSVHQVTVRSVYGNTFTEDRAYQDCPKLVAALQALQKFRAKKEKIEKQLQDEEQKLKAEREKYLIRAE